MTLNEQIKFYSKAEVQDDYGSLSQTRTLVATVFAKVRPMSGSERNRTDQNEQYADFRFTVLQRDDLQEDYILVWRGVDFNIRFIANNGTLDRYMYIDAERGGAM